MILYCAFALIFSNLFACQTGHVPELHQAVASGDMNLIEKLIKKGADVNQVAGFLKETPLMYYIGTADFSDEDNGVSEKIVTMLLEKKASALIPDCSQMLPVHSLAVRDRRSNGAKLFLTMLHATKYPFLSTPAGQTIPEFALDVDNVVRVCEFAQYVKDNNIPWPDTIALNVEKRITEKIGYLLNNRAMYEEKMVPDIDMVNITNELERLDQRILDLNTILLLMNKKPIQQP